MSRLDDYIESGILEQYVLGQTTDEETLEVMKMAAEHEAIRMAIDEISDSLESFARTNAVAPPVTVKPFLMATIDYMERMQNNEAPSVPPSLHAGSKMDDYAAWTKRPDMVPPNPVEGIFAKIIGHTPGELTAIVWIEKMAPEEVHDDEFEKFLILEGSCDIRIGDEMHSLSAGDFLQIPLHLPHEVKVTSSCPCKIILQRSAA